MIMIVSYLIYYQQGTYSGLTFVVYSQDLAPDLQIQALRRCRDLLQQLNAPLAVDRPLRIERWRAWNLGRRCAGNEVKDILISLLESEIDRKRRKGREARVQLVEEVPFVFLRADSVGLQRTMSVVAPVFQGTSAAYKEKDIAAVVAALDGGVLMASRLPEVDIIVAPGGILDRSITSHDDLVDPGYRD